MAQLELLAMPKRFPKFWLQQEEIRTTRSMTLPLKHIPKDGSCTSSITRRSVGSSLTSERIRARGSYGYIIIKIQKEFLRR